jgi:hypothetical protein
MATRAQVFVFGSGASLYVHFDGYPDGVMPTIVPALEHYRRQGEIWEPERILVFLVNAFAIKAEIRRQAVFLKTKKEIFKTPWVPRHYLVQGEEVVPGVEYLYIVHYDPRRDNKPKVRVFEVNQHPIREGATLTEVLASSTPLSWKPLGEAAVWMTVMRGYHKGVAWNKLIKRIGKMLGSPALPAIPKAS